MGLGSSTAAMRFGRETRRKAVALLGVGRDPRALRFDVAASVLGLQHLLLRSFRAAALLATDSGNARRFGALPAEDFPFHLVGEQLARPIPVQPLRPFELA